MENNEINNRYQMKMIIHSRSTIFTENRLKKHIEPRSTDTVVGTVYAAGSDSILEYCMEI